MRRRCRRPPADIAAALAQAPACRRIVFETGRMAPMLFHGLIARKKLVGRRVTLENQIRGLAVGFGVRLPRALSPAFIKQALRASEGIPGLSAAMRGLVAARAAVLGAVVAIRRAARSNDS